jgi:hypothetical protein
MCLRNGRFNVNDASTIIFGKAGPGEQSGAEIVIFFFEKELLWMPCRASGVRRVSS